MPEQPPSQRAAETVRDDPYVVLGVARDADARELSRAFRQALRRTHPDMGGSAEAFAAVQAAWRLLGDPDKRAEYDAPTDDWSFDDWGVDVDAASSGGVPPAAPAPTSDPSRERDGRVDVTNPFAAGAVPLPDAHLPTPRAVRGRGLWWADRLLRPLAFAAAGAMALTMIVGNARIDGPGYFVVVSLGMVVLAESWVLRTSGVRASYLTALTATGLAVTAAVGFVGTVTTQSSVLMAEAAVGVAAIGALRALTVWRAGYAEAREGATRRVGFAVERFQLAAEWNLVREALRTPGSSVERLVDHVRRGEQWRWACLNPLTGQTVTRDLDTEMPEGAWIVFDRSGELLAVAPPGSPEAWKRVVRAGGGR